MCKQFFLNGHDYKNFICVWQQTSYFPTPCPGILTNIPNGMTANSCALQGLAKKRRRGGGENHTEKQIGNGWGSETKPHWYLFLPIHAPSHSFGYKRHIELNESHSVWFPLLSKINTHSYMTQLFAWGNFSHRRTWPSFQYFHTKRPLYLKYSRMSV